MPFIKNVALFTRKVTPVTVLPQISAGYGQGGNNGHSLLVNALGRVFGWGGNQSGQIGDNTNLCRITPVSVAGATKTFCKISAGEAHSLAIDKNGKAWAWGSAQNFALGNANQFTAQSTPIAVGFTSQTFCKISAGYRYSTAIDKNGRAWGWGGNQQGNLGDGTITNQNQPVSVAGAVKTFCEISAGQLHTTAIDKNGRVWGWGNNDWGQLGNNSVTSERTPISVLGDVKTFCQISTGKTAFTLSIDKNGRAWSWGINSNGQLGDNTTTSKRTPVSVLGNVKTFCKISAGDNHAAAIDKNGRAWTWGSNTNGQLGDNSILSKNTPVSVYGTKTFCEISASGGTSYRYTLAVDKNGAVWGWGSTFGAFLGDGTILSRITPVSVLGNVKTFCQITSGAVHTIAIDKNGRVWGWGGNGNGRLGDNSTIQRATPVSVLGATKTFCHISAGTAHTVALDKNGRAWSWGQNNVGQLGDNSIIQRATPVSVLGATKTFCRISTGIGHTIALEKNGRSWSWGQNSAGQLGDNSLSNRSTPIAVLGATKTFCQISTGTSYSLAIDKNGRVWSWGFNSTGQLGNNSVTSERTPVSVLGNVKTFCQITAGASFSVAIDRYGRLWSWGNNSEGQLGDNTIVSQRTPISVLGNVKTFCKISAPSGGTFVVAIDKNGRAWSWGQNNVGQLGDNTIVSRRTPVSVLGAVKTFCQISTGTSHTIAIDKNGRAWSWGLDSSGQLGLNSGDRLTPVRVCTL
jgi:alpha-tubulin suppressor-like RCC1 family protein